MSATPNLEVRLAESGDSLKVREYLASFRTKVARKRGGPAWFDASPVHRWDESGLNEATQLLVCHIDSDFVGCALFAFHREEGRNDCELDLFVHGDVDQAKETVESLISAAEELAKKARATSLDIKSLPGDQLTKSTLEERGYKARLLVMNRHFDA